MKLKDKLARIRATTPNRSEFGQLYKSEKETKQRFKRVVLYTLFISDEATMLLRNHVFDSASPRSPRGWHEWFSEAIEGSGDNESRLSYIHRTAVLPGIALRTSKSWSVRAIIGWVGGGAKRDALSRLDNSAMANRRNKAKSKRKSHR